jgi:hypothetical protein
MDFRKNMVKQALSAANIPGGGRCREIKRGLRAHVEDIVEEARSHA